MSALRSKAEQRYAELHKRETDIKLGVETAARQLSEKTARLRKLRLAKEAEEAAKKQAEKDVKPVGKAASKKTRASSNS